MDYKAMCVQQWYIPSTCLLDGQIVWLLINEGKNPCDGCNHRRDICHGKEKSYEQMDSFEKTMCFFDRIEEKQREKVREEYKEQQEIIQNRKELHVNTGIFRIMEIATENNGGDKYFEVKIKDILDEKVYISKSKNIKDLLYYFTNYIIRFKIQQVHIDCGGMTEIVYMELLNRAKECNNSVDIIPFTYHPLKDNTVVNIYEDMLNDNNIIHEILHFD